LFEPFDLLQRMRRESDPSRQRIPRVGVHTDVLPDAPFEEHPVGRITKERNRRAREIHCASAVVGDDFDEMRNGECAVGRAGGGGSELEAAAGDDASRAAKGCCCDKRLVALDVQNGVERLIGGPGCHLGHAVGAGRVACVSQLHLCPGLAGRLHDLLTLGGDDAPLGDSHLLDALPDANDEWESGEEAKGFAREARRAQTGWDDGQRPHSARCGGRAAAKCTPPKLPPGARERKRGARAL
jgi:hypothetical protein